MSEISVLFAVEAEQLLLAEMYEEAIELCNSGLNVYPEYASAYGIIARALQQLGRSSEATEIINNAVKQFPTNRLLKTIAEDIELQTSNLETIAKNLDDSKNSKSDFDLDDMIQSTIDNNPFHNFDSIIPEDNDGLANFEHNEIEQISDNEFVVIPSEEVDNSLDDIVINTNDKIDSYNSILDETINPDSDFNIDDLFSNNIPSSNEIHTTDEQNSNINLDIEQELNELVSNANVEINTIDTFIANEGLDIDAEIGTSSLSDIEQYETIKSDEQINPLETFAENNISDFNIEVTNNLEEHVSDNFDSEFEESDYAEDSIEDNSENEALLAQLYNEIDAEDEDTSPIAGHVNNDDFLLNLTAKLSAVNSALPVISPEADPLASAQVYDFSQSTYEDELGEIDEEIISELPFAASTDNSIENAQEEIPTHLAQYVGLNGFALKLMRSDSVFDRKIRSRHLSLIPGLDNSPIRELRYIQKKTYSYQSLPQEPDYCVKALLPKDDQSDFASLFGFKSFQEQSSHIIDNSIETNASKSSTEVKKDLITETIANIYVLQGAYQEAINAYSDLADQYPDKREYFEKKIRDTIAKEENNLIKE